MKGPPPQGPALHARSLRSPHPVLAPAVAPRLLRASPARVLRAAAVAAAVRAPLADRRDRRRDRLGASAANRKSALWAA